MVKPAFKKLAKMLEIVNVDLSNSEIHFPFQFSNRNLEKSLHHQLEYGGTYQDYVKAMSCFEEIVANAAVVEVHGEKKRGTAKENRDLIRTYVLVGAYRDGKKIVPVQLEVKEFRTRGNNLYMNVILTKIESEVMDTGVPEEIGNVPYLFSDSNVSLRYIFANVNPADGRFLKYVPDGFLNDDQRRAKNNALEKQAQEYASYGPAKQFSVSETTTEADTEEGTPVVTRQSLNYKARQHLADAERDLLNFFSYHLGVSRMARRENLLPVLREISDAYLGNDTVSNEKVEELFDKAYEAGRVIDRMQDVFCLRNKLRNADKFL